MKDLLININDNYNMNIKNIRKLGITTINDIFVINSSSKKYIVKKSCFVIKVIHRCLR